MVDYRPKAILRESLSKVFDDFRTIRSIEQLFDLFPINVDEDDNANTLALIQRYLLANIGVVEADGITSDFTDTLFVKPISNDITISLHTDALNGKIIVVKFVEGEYQLIIDAAGNTIDGESTFELFLGESVMIQADTDNNWWII